MQRSSGLLGVLSVSLLLLACSGETAPPPAPNPAPQGGSGGSSTTVENPPPGPPAPPPPVDNPVPNHPVPEPDAGPTPMPEPDAGPEPDPDPDPEPPVELPFNCTLVIGINATAEWYEVGFEDVVDDDKWELIRVHSGFVQLWADPDNAFWDTEIASPCAENASSPDRVIFVALNFDYTELDQWLPALRGTVQNIKDKYAGVRRIELQTFVRAPNNEACPQKPANRSTIHPSQDEAIAMVVAEDPELLVASPKFEVQNCNHFTDNPPHPSDAGADYIIEMMAAHYEPKE